MSVKGSLGICKHILVDMFHEVVPSTLRKG